MGDYSEAKKSSSKLIVDNIKAKTSLPKPIEGHIEAKIGLLATIIDSKYVLLVYKGIFPKHLYIIL
jgi:hypothetical protein